MKYFNETYIKRKFVTRNEWADTYKAIHSTTEEKVTLKVLVRKSKDEEYINNLLKEVEILKNIKNPNLINVNNMFQYSGCGKIYYYIEGEYFKGISLEEKLQSGKLEEQEAIKIVETVAQGLKEFHGRNILFNNLNLSNIFINSKEVVKTDVLSYLENKDFVVLSHDETEEKVEEYKFSPEKDIYDLGVILYGLLTGKSTFEPNNYKKQISNVNLTSIIEKATNNNLESKYRNINRFIADLKSYLQCGELSNESYDVEEVSSKKRKKGKLGKTIGVCAVIALVGGATVYGYDLLEKNKKDSETNITKVEESTKPKEEDKKVEENKEENKEEKTEEEKTTNSSNKDNQSNEKNSYSSNSEKNTSNSNSKKKNSSSNDSSNNTSKPSKPDNNGSSDNTTTKPDNVNDNEDKTPEVTPPSNDSDGDSTGGENTTTESPDKETESQNK